MQLVSAKNIVSIFCKKESGKNSEYNETNWEMVQQTSHVDHSAQPKNENNSYHIQNNHMKDKMLHPASDILPMKNLIT